jgi:hypothetical protein
MKIVETAKKIEQARLTQGVKYLCASPLRTHNADAAQDRQMIGHRRNIELHQGRQIGHAMLPFG